MEFRWLDLVFVIGLGILYWMFFKKSKKTDRHEEILKNSEE